MIGIIQDLTNARGNTTEGLSPQAILNFSSKLKKLGFEECFIHQKQISQSTLMDNLTICFYPNFDYDIEKTEHDSRRDSYSNLRTHLMSLSGNSNFNYYNALKRYAFEDQVELKIRFENKLYIIGHYVPHKNLVLIYPPIYETNWALGKENEYLNFLLSNIETLKKEHKFEKVDVAEIKKKLLIKKYTIIIEDKLRRCKNELIDAEDSIESYQKKVVECHSKISQNRYAVKGLEKMINDVQNTLLEQIEDIKKLKFVKEAKLTDDGIILRFEKISIKVKGEDIEMGDYEITLFSDKFKIINEQPVIKDGSTYHSCHISGDTICFGAQEPMARELLGTLQLKKLTHFLYLYLKSYNPEDTYLSMNYWIAGKNNNGIVPNDYDEDEEEHEDQTYCEECLEWVDNDVYNSDEEMCNDCWDNNSSHCSNCGETVNNDDYNSSEDMCNDCWEKESTYCDECGERVPCDEFNSNENMCDSCWEDKSCTCGECGNQVRDDDFDSSLNLCSDCAKNKEESEETQEENTEGSN